MKWVMLQTVYLLVSVDVVCLDDGYHPFEFPAFRHGIVCGIT